MLIPLYQVDAFTDTVFQGNPAAVCPLETWLPDHVMQAIAAENNLSETAFLVPQGKDFHLRWFTPTVEINLCGHGTLATAYVLFEFLEPGRQQVRFHTLSGPLEVRTQEELLFLDLPARPVQPVDTPPELVEALAVRPQAVLAAHNYLVVLDSAARVQNLAPDLEVLAHLDRPVIVTAPGHGDQADGDQADGDQAGADFVSRFFAPTHGIPEDPVTGAAHCSLVPYWARRLQRQRLLARQLSARGGTLHCIDQGERVALGGQAVLYLEGAISL